MWHIYVVRISSWWVVGLRAWVPCWLPAWDSPAHSSWLRGLSIGWLTRDLASSCGLHRSWFLLVVRVAAGFHSVGGHEQGGPQSPFVTWPQNWHSMTCVIFFWIGPTQSFGVGSTERESQEVGPLGGSPERLPATVWGWRKLQKC